MSKGNGINMFSNRQSDGFTDGMREMCRLIQFQDGLGTVLLLKDNSPHPCF